MSDLILPPLGSTELDPRAFVGHWTGGAQVSNQVDRDSYTALIEQRRDGIRIVPGVPAARNLRSLRGVRSARWERENLGEVRDGYAAHAGGLNTGTLGFALCGMRGSSDFRPAGDVYPGPDPITLWQVRGLLGLWHMAFRVYGLEVVPEHYPTHYEIYRLFGVGRQDKWNITWLPGLGLSSDDVGPYLREQLERWIRGVHIDARLYEPPPGLTQEEALEGDEAA